MCSPFEQRGGRIMSALDTWGTYETPCPDCNGEVKHWFFGGDCRGNQGSGGIQCKGCRRSFTYTEWEVIAREELGQRGSI